MQGTPTCFRCPVMAGRGFVLQLLKRLHPDISGFLFDGGPLGLWRWPSLACDAAQGRSLGFVASGGPMKVRALPELWPEIVRWIPERKRDAIRPARKGRLA